MPVFRRKNSHDSDIADCLESLCRGATSDAQELDVVLTASTANQSFTHGLKRPYRGVVVVGQSAAVAIYPKLPSTSSDPSRRFVLALGAATACNARVLVY